MSVSPDRSPAYDAVLRGETSRPRPADLFAAATALYDAGERLDMNRLAADLGVARATVYRWAGDRERLLADVIWASARAALERISARQGATGQALLVAVCGDFVELLAADTRLARFLEHEGAAGLQMLTDPAGAIRPRLVEAAAALIRAEADAGRYRPPADPDVLADATTSVGEHFLYARSVAGFAPQPDKARLAIRLLLREEERE